MRILARMAFCSAAWLAMIGPAWAVDWQVVDSSDSALWYDVDSLEWDEDYVYFDIFHGAWTGAESMSSNAVSLAVDCVDGQFFVWNGGTAAWEASNAYPTSDSLDELAFEACMPF